MPKRTRPEALSSLSPSEGEHGTASVARRLRVHSSISVEAAAALDWLLGRPIAFEPGALVAQAGENADLVTVVQKGLACRMSLLADSRRQIHSLLLPGETADAEAALLHLRADNVEALTRCCVWLVPKTRFAGLVHSQPQLAEAFARETAIAAQVAREWVVNLGRRNAVERLAHFICELSTRFDAIGATKQNAFVLPLTQQDIADAQGMSAVHVNRVLNELRAKFLIRTDKHVLTVLDRSALESLAMFDAAYLHLRQLAA